MPSFFLIVAAELHIAIVILKQIVEVVALHYHVVELKEGETLLHPLLIALGSEHIIDREAGTDLAQQIDIVEVEQPIGVVDHLSLALAELDETLHLPPEAIGVMLDILPREHLSHIGAAAGVADHRSAAADKGDGGVARHLEALHKGKSHEMTRCKAVRRAVKADIEFRLAAVDKLSDLRFVCDLCNESSCNKLFINLHFLFSLSVIFMSA